MYSLYKDAECVTYVTRTGPTNVPPLEALKIGTPLICSNVYEMKMQIGSKSAIFINPKKIDEIEKSIIKILKNKGLKARLVKNGRKKIKNLSLKNFSNRFNEIVTSGTT